MKVLRLFLITLFFSFAISSARAQVAQYAFFGYTPNAIQTFFKDFYPSFEEGVWKTIPNTPITFLRFQKKISPNVRKDSPIIINYDFDKQNKCTRVELCYADPDYFYRVKESLNENYTPSKTLKHVWYYKDVKIELEMSDGSFWIYLTPKPETGNE